MIIIGVAFVFGSLDGVKLSLCVFFGYGDWTLGHMGVKLFMNVDCLVIAVIDGTGCKGIWLGSCILIGVES